MKNLFSRFANDESGATAIEYGLIAALMAVAIVAGIGAITGGLQGAFDSIAGTLDGARPD